MVFSSTVFLFIFLPATLLGYYLIRKDLRNAFLLAMSLLFYAVGEPVFVLVMMASILANYLLGLLLWKTRKRGTILRRGILLITLAANLGLLFYFKYYDFAVANINSLVGTSFALKHIALPIGISFFTFQGMSYVLDVYMGKTEVQRNPLNVALYIALFPQLIAGPIVRYSDINGEIVSRRENLDDFASGVQRFAVGLAKKVILSNNFALLADQAYATPAENLGAGMAWLGALAYTMQIYFDFSGYSDMAIGLGRMFGFHIRENFNYPYVAHSVQDFWRRWHMSLSTWFRDYVYIPLGGNRKGNVYINLLIVFFLTGLWHGASWNFVVWGLWHGLFLMVERLFRKKENKRRIPKPVGWIYTMLIVVIGWVFFRAQNLKAAVAYLGCMAGLGGTDGNTAIYALEDYGVIFILGIICMLPVMQRYKYLRETYVIWQKSSVILEPLCCVVLLAIGMAFTVSSSYNPFIYFNF
ncbi:MAG: MBOAT family protein [Acidaminococcaceae bacterium]|nr:MBOAT family protein [Acidaminococcaceae bacterium]